MVVPEVGVHDAGDVSVLLDVLVELDALHESRGAVADAGNGYLDDRISSSISARVINRLRRYPFKDFPEVRGRLLEDLPHYAE